MSVNIKLGNKTITGVEAVQLKNASSDGTYIKFEQSTSVENGYTVQFMVEGRLYSSVSVMADSVVSRPTSPTAASKYFIGWYDAETAGAEITFPYTPTSNVTFYAHFTSSIIVGVTGLTNSSGDLTLTDSISNVDTYTTVRNENFTSVVNPLSEYFPFNQIEEFTDSEGNVFVKFPKIWMKWEKDSSGNISGYKFSNGKADDDYFISDAYLNPSDTTGNTYCDYFALGKYEMSGSSSKGFSKSGVPCLTNITIADAREASRAYGNASNLANGYQQLDLAQLVMYNLLCMMFYRTANIQKVYGGRTGCGTVPMWENASVTGTCDGVAGMNGWNTSTDCVKMLGIENPYGNVFKWVDGVWFSDATIYVHRFSQQYTDGTWNAKTLQFNRPTSDGYVKYLKSGDTSDTRSFVYASETTGDSNSEPTYYGDYAWYTSTVTGTVLCAGGAWDFTTAAGLWSLTGSHTNSVTYPLIGARLSYRPL